MQPELSQFWLIICPTLKVPD